MPLAKCRPRSLLVCAVLFGALVFAVSSWQWWTFRYTTFDLAFYVQALWLALRGQWHVSLLNVPLLGNHAEPIVFLAAPLFAICPHPMTLVALQTAALATMPCTAWRIAARFGLDSRAATFLAVAIVLTPATGFVALHEFHPEALAAPLLLLLIEARQAARLRLFWLWFIAVLACKENLALVLIAWSVMHGILDWQRDRFWQLRWNGLPLVVALTWFLFYAIVLSPALNAGNVDYLELYSHLGKSPGDIVRNFFTHPQAALGALGKAATTGNLVWGLLLPFLGLPLLRPRWLLIAAPVLLQHLLSWRPSEWSIEAHYAAPLIPLFWVATTQAIAHARLQTAAAGLVLSACLLAQFCMGPVLIGVRECRTARERFIERSWKTKLIDTIPPAASVTAGIPYLSHLATRSRLYSLHHILKGLKTLSRATYVPPPPTEVVLVDYADDASFSVQAGYYHPQMRTADLRIVPPSDRLLHEFLRQAAWSEKSANALHVYTRDSSPAAFSFEPTPLPVCAGTNLLTVETGPARNDDAAVALRLAWEFTGEREKFPWLMFVLSSATTQVVISKGPCAPAVITGSAPEEWEVILPPTIAPGTYSAKIVLYDHTLAAWQGAFPPRDNRFVFRTILLGPLRLIDGKLLLPDSQ